MFNFSKKFFLFLLFLSLILVLIIISFINFYGFSQDNLNLNLNLNLVSGNIYSENIHILDLIHKSQADLILLEPLIRSSDVLAIGLKNYLLELISMLQADLNLLESIIRSKNNTNLVSQDY